MRRQPVRIFNQEAFASQKNIFSLITFRNEGIDSLTVHNQMEAMTRKSPVPYGVDLFPDGEFGSVFFARSIGDVYVGNIFRYLETKFHVISSILQVSPRASAIPLLLLLQRIFARK